MKLAEHFRHSGNWLFRWRSYVPLITIAVMLLAAGQWGDTGRLPAAMQVVFLVTAVLVSLSGLAVRGYAVGCAPKGTSGRNTRQQKAESLNTTGIYSVVRHPLYVGNYLMGLGVSFLTFTWWLPVLYSFFFWVYYERIMYAEEAFLEEQFGGAFTEWASRTPAFIPKLSLYRRSELPFSMKNVLRREYNGAYAVALLFVVFHVVGDAVHERLPVFGRPEAITLAVATVAWLILRTIKRRTEWFSVAGR